MELGHPLDRKPPRLGVGVLVTLAGLALLGSPSDVQGGLPGLLAGLVARASAAVGQFDGGDGPETEPADPSLFLTDRTVMQRLEQGRVLLDQARYGEAVRFFDAILASPQDYFYQPDRAQPVFQSVKTTAERLLGELPRAGRESYELQFGPTARQLLDEAIARRDPNALAEVARRYFHTEAGYRAAYLEALHDHHAGRALAAALGLSRLAAVPEARRQLEPGLSLELATSWLSAGQPETASQVLRAWAADSPQQVSIGGNAVPVFGPADDPLAWLVAQVGERGESPLGPSAADWLLHRGDPGRNPPGAAAMPLLTSRWRVRTSNDPLVEETLTRLGHDYRERGLSALPGLQPLVVGERVVMRTALAVQCVDFRTGKRLWESAAAESAGRMLAGRGSWTAVRAPTQFEWGLEQRMWDDATFGTLSSDGRRVFGIEDLSLGPGLSAMPTAVLANLRRRGALNVARAENRLVAHDLVSGKLLWEIGGPVVPGGLAEAGSFFLGPPLPLGGLLYALAERSGEIRLVALDAATGAARWSQQLAVVEESVLQNRSRRMSGASPSYADGVLVCPTVAGAVVAIDLSRRALVWGYQYPRPIDSQRQELLGQGVVLGRLMSQGPDGPGERWIDALVTLAERRVLVTPVETNELHCLDLVTGEVLWKTIRKDGLYLAGVRQGRVIVVGRGQVQCYQLADGSPGWAEGGVDLPSGSQPSGRGCWGAADRYLVPLTTGEVAELDVATGTWVGRARSRHGEVPGNLVAHQGSLLSQNVDALALFPQLAPLEELVANRLADNPADPRALALEGETLLERGEWQRAAASLRRARELDDRPAVRELLVAVLLTGLERDFAGFRDYRAELEEIVDRPEDRARYLRLLAAGWQEAGDYLEAFRVYLRLAERELGPEAMEAVDPHTRVRRDRWVRAELEQLFSRADEAGRQAMQAELTRRLAAARAEPGPGALRRFLRYFASGPTLAEARRALAERLDPRRDRLELELLWRPLADDPDPAVWAEATWHLARLTEAGGRPREAAAWYRRLSAAPAELPLAGGTSVGQVLATLPAEHPFRAAASADPWPRGRVTVDSTSGAQPSYVRNGLPVRGQVDPGQDDLIFEWDHARQGQPLVAVDGLGKELWQVPLVELNQRGGFQLTPAYNHVQLVGHLALVSIDRRVLAIDTFAVSERGREPILWSVDTSDSLPGTPGTQMIQTQAVQLEWGATRATVSDGYGRVLSLVGPANEELLVIPRHRSLTVVDPRTGETLWTRTNLPAGCECFGDGEYLFALPADGDEAIVLRASDGRELGTRRLPSAAERMATLGRRVLAWTQGPGDERIVRLVDAWSGAELWRRTVTLGSKADVVDGTQLALVQPDGRFWLVNLADGAAVIEAQLEPFDNLVEAFLVAAPEHYLLFLNRPPDSEGSVWLRPIPTTTDYHSVNGRVVGFERATGQVAWTREIARQSLVARQPRQLPVLVLACHVYERPNAAGRQNRNHVAILCLDKRTGRAAYQNRLQAGLAGYAVSADPAARTLAVRLLRETITLNFTDEPWPSDEPADEANDGGGESSGQAGEIRTPADRPAAEPNAEADPPPAEAAPELAPDEEIP